MSYTKLFSSIVTSTIWTEDDKTRIVWITMLAIADKNGEVQASIPGLARVAGVSLPDCEAAILKLISPDPYSRTPDDEGRRIEKIDGGWALLNHAKYRAMASKDEAVTANAERQRRHRERKKRNGSVTDSNGECEIVTEDRDIAEAKADTEAEEVNILPSGWSRLSQAEKGRKKVNFNDPTMIRIGSWFRQKPTTLWTIAEYLALRDVAPEEEDLHLIGEHYSYDIEKNGFRYKAIVTLLNNWSTARSKAHAFFQENPTLPL